LLLDPETVPLLKMDIGGNEERYNEGYNPEMIPTSNVKIKRLRISLRETLRISSFEVR
jgi:hypothetical protein